MSTEKIILIDNCEPFRDHKFINHLKISISFLLVGFLRILLLNWQRHIPCFTSSPQLFELPFQVLSAKPADEEQRKR